MAGVPDPRDTIKAPASTNAGTGCRAGGRCGGVGWVQVTAAYAEKLFPLPPAATLEDADHAAAFAALAEAVERRRRAAADSWYPCRECEPSLFYRWAGRHLDSKHDRAGCAECSLEDEEKRRRPRTERAAPAHAAPAPSPAHASEEF